MATISFRQLVTAFESMGINRSKPVIAHASLSAFGEISGGAETLLGAMLAVCGGVMMPTFTYKTIVTPPVGPQNNGMEYATQQDLNQMAEFFRPDMPADSLMGRLAETLRRHPRARRSSHPILSFAGIQVEKALAAQTLDDPLRPIQVLAEQGGSVLLLGVDHTSNTSLHMAEKLAGRKQFVRWALTPGGVVECPGFPGSSEGFMEAARHLRGITRQAWVGKAALQTIPIAEMAEIIKKLIEKNPLIMLPEDSADLRVRDARLAAGT